MKIYFLAPYPYDEVASQRFRFEQYYKELRNENIWYDTGSFYTIWSYRVLYKKGYLPVKSAGFLAGFIKRSWHAIKSLSFDYVFIHRELTPVGPPVFEWLIGRIFRKKIIYDFDDAIWMVEKKNNKLMEILKWRKKVNKICSWAYRISCGNHYLAGYARQFNSRIIVNPTTIDLNIAGNSEPLLKKDCLTIGWTGTHSTLPYIEVILEPVRKILEDFPGTRFLIICNKKPEFSFERLDFLKWRKSTEWTDLAKIDIGLMPLSDTEWSQGKCGFKILQYFAAGIPALASPVGVNAKLIQPGENGFLCTNNQEWYNAISALLKDEKLRIRLGKNGKKFLTDNYSLTSNRTNFLRLFE